METENSAEINLGIRDLNVEILFMGSSISERFSTSNVLPISSVQIVSSYPPRLLLFILNRWV